MAAGRLKSLIFSYSGSNTSQLLSCWRANYRTLFSSKLTCHQPICKFSASTLTDILNSSENPTSTTEKNKGGKAASESNDYVDDISGLQDEQTLTLDALTKEIIDNNHVNHTSETSQFRERKDVDEDRSYVPRTSASVSVRTHENNPERHTAHDFFKYYTIDKDVVQSLQLSKILRTEFVARSKALQETSIMVREPALECLELLKASTAKESMAAKVVLYGQNGCGKTAAFAHALHSCQNMDWLIICPVQHYLWNNYFKEISASSHKAGRVDLPQQGVELLSAIKQMNANVFKKFGDRLRTRDSYSWSRRETTDSDTTLEEFIEFGIERPKYSCDVVGALLKEIRLHATEWPIPVVLAIDGVNSLFGTTRIFTDRAKQERLPVSQISLVHNLVKLLSSDWKNGCMLLVADIKSSPVSYRVSSQPRQLLGETGFDAVNPFVPVEVKDYSDEEMSVTLDYLTEMQWIQSEAYRTSKQARKELVFLSANNPLFLDKLLRAT